MSELRGSAAELLPPPSAELVLLRVAIEAFIATAPRKRSERFLKLMAQTLAREENLSGLFHIRPMSDRAAVQRARRQASAMFEAYLPVWLAGIPGDGE